MNAPIIIDGVSFEADESLENWIQQRSSQAHWFFELHSIARAIRPTLVGVQRVQLYAVASSGRLYVKMFDASGHRQEEWRLEFQRNGKLLSRIGS